MDVDFFRENLPNGEPMSRGGQLLSEIEAEPSTDEGAFRPTLGLGAWLYAESDEPERRPSLRPLREPGSESQCYSG